MHRFEISCSTRFCKFYLYYKQLNLTIIYNFMSFGTSSNAEFCLSFIFYAKFLELYIIYLKKIKKEICYKCYFHIQKFKFCIILIHCRN